MTESFEEALRQEVLAWQHLEIVARQQCQAVVRREAQGLDDLREGLQEAVRLALLTRHESLRLRPPEIDAAQTELVGQADEAQTRARQAIRLNLELLRDTCSYLEMIRGVVHPEAVPARYGRRRPAPAVPTAAHERVA